MSITITGFVTHGVIVPSSPLPDGAQVEIRVKSTPTESAQVTPGRVTPSELRSMPRERRNAILATAAALAEQDYRDDKDLAGFDAFSEEPLDDDESDAR